MNKRWTDQEMQMKAQSLLDWYDEVRTLAPKVANIYGDISRVCYYLEGSDYPAEYESDQRRHQAVQDEYRQAYNALWYYAHR
jgi:hypothetical protein